jgi:hypothetical protein
MCYNTVNAFVTVLCIEARSMCGIKDLCSALRLALKG